MSKLSDVAPPKSVEVAILNGKKVVFAPITLLTMMEIEEEHGISIDDWVKKISRANKLAELLDALWMMVSNKDDFADKKHLFACMGMGHMRQMQAAIMGLATQSMPAPKATGTAPQEGEGNGRSGTGATSSQPSPARTRTRSKKS